MIWGKDSERKSGIHKRNLYSYFDNFTKEIINLNNIWLEGSLIKVENVSLQHNFWNLPLGHSHENKFFDNMV